MTATKTKEPTQAEQRRAALADAEQRQALGRERGQRAHEQWREFKARQATGDLSLTPAELREAEDDAKHWDIVNASLDHQVKLAERRLVPDHPELAKAVAFNIGGAHYGIEAEAVDAIPEYDPDDPAPRVVVRQFGMHTIDPGGAIYGEVEVVLVAPGYVQPLEPNAIGQALLAAGARPELVGRPMHPGRVMDRFTVTAWPEVLRIATPPQDAAADNFANGTANEIENLSFAYSLGGAAITASGSGKVLRVDEGESQRVTVIEVKVAARAARDSRGDQWLSEAEVRSAVEKHLLSLGGRVVPAIGRISAVELGIGRPVLNVQGYRIADELAALVTVRSEVG